MEQAPVVKLNWKEIKDDLVVKIYNIEVMLALYRVQLAKAEEFAAKK